MGSHREESCGHGRNTVDIHRKNTIKEEYLIEKGLLAQVVLNGRSQYRSNLMRRSRNCTRHSSTTR